MPLSFVIDEDTRDRGIWHAIQQHNSSHPTESIDAVRVGDPGCIASGSSDLEVLEWSIQENRVVLSHDANTMTKAHDELLAQGTETPGLLILPPKPSIPALVGLLRLYGQAGQPADFASRTDFLHGEV